MNPPSSPPDTFGVPPPPAPLNRLHLWISLLGPTLSLILFFLSDNLTPLNIQRLEFFGHSFGEILWGLARLLTLSCWILFCYIITKRYRSNSLVILMFAYPIGQAILLTSIIFGSCIFGY